MMTTFSSSTRVTSLLVRRSCSLIGRTRTTTRNLLWPAHMSFLYAAVDFEWPRPAMANSQHSYAS